MKKRESKFRKLGRLNGFQSKAFISLLIQEQARDFYTRNFLYELKNYSFRVHRQDEPRHEGCKSWIEELNSDFNPRSPIQYARLIKANFDGLQQKRHARNYYLGFLEAFS